MHTSIEIIGAGSATFSLDIVRDLATTPGLFGANLRLTDVDEGRLRAIGAIARSYSDEFNAGFTIEQSTTWGGEHKVAADFVILAALQGGRSTMDDDRSLLEGYGYYRGIGINTPFRQLKLMLDVGEHIRATNPDATLIMAANPIPEGCGLVRQQTGIETIGICHGHDEFKNFYRLLGITDDELVESEIVGINHNIWLNKITYDGRDAYPLIGAWAKNVSNAFYDFYLPHARYPDYQLSRAVVDMYLRYGLLPVADTCRGIMPEFWWYADSPQTKQYLFGPSEGFDGDPGHKTNVSTLSGTAAKMSTFQEGQSATRAFGTNRSPWDIVPYIDAKLNDAATRLQISFENQGAIAGLDADTFVEAPVIVNGTGLHRYEPCVLPNNVLLGALKPRELIAQRIIAGMRERSEALFLQTWLADHKTQSVEQAEEAWGALITAPWNTDMLEYFRGE